MKQVNQGFADLFYGFFSLAKPRKPKGNSFAEEWAAHVLPHTPIAELTKVGHQL